MGDNAAMEVSPEERQSLEAALAELDGLDPADLPDPAARLADLLGRMLDAAEGEA